MTFFCNENSCSSAFFPHDVPPFRRGFRSCTMLVIRLVVLSAMITSTFSFASQIIWEAHEKVEVIMRRGVICPDTS